MSEYDDFVESTWIDNPQYTQDHAELARVTLGIVGEAGEVAEHIKKYLRGDGLLDQRAVLDELGDIIYYIAILSHRLGADLETVVQRNMVKLSARKARGRIKGSGSER